MGNGDEESVHVNERRKMKEKEGKKRGRYRVLGRAAGKAGRLGRRGGGGDGGQAVARMGAVGVAQMGGGG